jgi:hypothetical protein
MLSVVVLSVVMLGVVELFHLSEKPSLVLIHASESKLERMYLWLILRCLTHVGKVYELNQGTLTKGEGSVRLTSSLR